VTDYNLDEDALEKQLASQGLAPARYRQVLDDLVKAGLVSRIAYRAADGSLSHRLKGADWVAGDPDRAVRALDAVRDKGKA
jgi:hypothetical protein